jgi:hypothetical protein
MRFSRNIANSEKKTRILFEDAAELTYIGPQLSLVTPTQPTLISPKLRNLSLYTLLAHSGRSQADAR